MTRVGSSLLAALLAASLLTHAQGPAPIVVDLSSPARLDTDWTLDGSGAWAIRDGVLALEKAGVPSGPLMSAVDTTFVSGRVGVGSFDDTAEFRSIRLDGRAAGGARE